MSPTAAGSAVASLSAAPDRQEDRQPGTLGDEQQRMAPSDAKQVPVPVAESGSRHIRPFVELLQPPQQPLCTPDDNHAQ